MTALIGWGGTADFTDSWVYDQASDTYALDAEMAKNYEMLILKRSATSSAEC